MRFGVVSPYARGALGRDALDRLHWHMARGLCLSIVSADDSPYRFVVRLTRDDFQLEREAGRSRLFETVAQMLLDAGEPLPTSVEFQRLKALA